MCNSGKKVSFKHFSSSTAESFSYNSLKNIPKLYPDEVEEDNDSVSSDSDSENDIDLNVLLSKANNADDNLKKKGVDKIRVASSKSVNSSSGSDKTPIRNF